jgi:hypothetical protein
VHDGRQDVAPLVVRAEEERRIAALDPRRRLERRVQVKRGGVERVLRRNPGRQRGGADAQERQRRTAVTGDGKLRRRRGPDPAEIGSSFNPRG